MPSTVSSPIRARKPSTAANCQPIIGQVVFLLDRWAVQRGHGRTHGRSPAPNGSPQPGKVLRTGEKLGPRSPRDAAATRPDGTRHRIVAGALEPAGDPLLRPPP